VVIAVDVNAAGLHGVLRPPQREPPPPANDHPICQERSGEPERVQPVSRFSLCRERGWSRVRGEFGWRRAANPLQLVSAQLPRLSELDPA